MEDKVGRACSTHRREEEFIQDFDGKARRKDTTRELWLRIGTSGGLL
jgi:hypothetical protein